MDINFWKQRWQENQIGFHLDEVNPHLKQFWSTLKLAQGSHVLVPMCGKSLDLMWLQQSGYSVTGIECSRLAVEAFFTEQNLHANHEPAGDLHAYHTDNLRLLLGDFFALQANLIPDVAAVYDRAALIALPADMRKAYVEKLFTVLPVTAVILLVTLEYNQAVMQGPPFSVTETEVQNLYANRFIIHKLQQRDVLPDQPRFAERGLNKLLETVYLLQPAPAI